MTDKDFFEAVLQEAKNLDLISQKVKFGKKSDFWYHCWFNRILNIVYPPDKKDTYLNNYWTTVGYTIAAPDDRVDDQGRCGNWTTLIHELEHTRQARKWTRVIFGYFYLWPLSQGLLCMLLCWLPALFLSGWVMWLSMVSLLFVGGLHFISQLPDPWRTHWEYKAYEISMFFHYRLQGVIDSAYLDRLVGNFTSMAYFIMEPRKKKIRKKLLLASVNITKGRRKVIHNPLVKLAL